MRLRLLCRVGMRVNRLEAWTTTGDMGTLIVILEAARVEVCKSRARRLRNAMSVAWVWVLRAAAGIGGWLNPRTPDGDRWG